MSEGEQKQPASRPPREGRPPQGGRDRRPGGRGDQRPAGRGGGGQGQSKGGDGGGRGGGGRGGDQRRRKPLSPSEHRRKMADERLEVWTPRTELGRLVLAGKIKTFHEALASRLPLREPEIVDILLNDLKDEVMDIHMVQRMSDSGRRVRFAVTTVVGNGNGLIGLGRVSGKLVRPTIAKSMDRAKLNLIEIRRGSGSWECTTAEPNSLPFTVKGRSGSTRVTLKPAPPGVGLVTNNVGQIMLGLAGVKDIWSFSSGKTQTIYNFANAIYRALITTSSTKMLPGQEEHLNIITGVR